MMSIDWARIENADAVPSPALLVYPDRGEENLRRMIAIAGDPARLRPHIKTHKLPQFIARQAALGIVKCKCATIAEAEMAAGAGATDVLLAGQLTGPNVARFLALIRMFPNVNFSAITDDWLALETISAAAERPVDMLLDLDVGQHRTGIAPGPAAIDLYRAIVSLPGLSAGGLHAYDGHLHQRDLEERRAAADDVASAVVIFRNELLGHGWPVPRVVIGGTPTFPFHARHPDFECSPGTSVLWDAGYAANLPDLDFLLAAVLLTRVVSRPTKERVCLDLGHKAVASEMPQPRVIFPALADAKVVGHNEEHLVLETARASEFPVGTALYGIPWHVCPTVALHATVHVVHDGCVVDEWPVAARARKLTI
ncbi:MAG: D-TA family PLP-dependent enzyme [Chthoniobacteraceae bacterium]